MTKQIALVSDREKGTILEQGQFEWWETEEHGISFKRDTPQAKWLEALEQLLSIYEGSKKLHTKSMFMIGDALRFGEAAYGEEFAQGIDMTRKALALDAKSIKNAAWIAGSIDPSRRREELSMTHHEIVARLKPEEQDRMLLKATQENLSTAALKKIVKEEFPPEKPRATKNPKPKNSVTIDLDSEEGLRHALTKVCDYLEAEHEKEELKFWSENRRVQWGHDLKRARLAARRMGILK